MSCKTVYVSDGCLIFPEIKDLSEQNKTEIYSTTIPDSWFESVVNYREIRKKQCSAW